MGIKKHPLIENAVPFLLLGVAIAFGVAMFMMLAYVLFYGLIIGVVIWGAVALKNFLFPPKSSNSSKENKGRVIDYDDIE